MSRSPRFAYKKRISAVITLIIILCGQPYPASAQFDADSIQTSVALPPQDEGVGANFIVPGPNLLQDSGFEQSYGSTTGPWLQAPPDTICFTTDQTCVDDGAGYWEGGGWAWFGGEGSNANIVSQSVTFPRCGAILEFLLYIGRSNGLNRNFFQALIDDTEVFRTDATKSSFYATYTRVAVDVSQFADGNVHTVKFYSETPDVFQVFFNLDGVSLKQTVSSSSNCAGIRITAGVPLDAYSYGLSPNTSDRASLPNVNQGPVVIDNYANSVPFVASERVAYTPDGGTTWTSYAELMGFPYNLLGKKYFFPRYNNKDINTQLRVGSLDTDFDTTVTVRIGGILRGTYNLTPNTTLRISYPDLDSGPVVIESSSQLIIASERVAYQNPQSGKWTSFTEMMGLPSSQLSTTYLFPWFNALALNSQLRFGNVGTIPTTVIVKIGGIEKGRYTLLPNASMRVAYPVDNGPVLIQSLNAPIIASLRVAYTPNNGATWTDVSEMMGFPIASVGTRYSFPWYNNKTLNTQLRFANVGNVNTLVTVKIGGVVLGTYPLAPNQSKRVAYAINNGPVVIESSGAVKIIASERVAYSPNNGITWTSFSEMMGLPSSQLTDHYVFPWYNNVDLNTQLRFGVP